MRVTYVGPMPEVFIPEHDEFLDISNGDTIEVSAAVGQSLLSGNHVDEFAPVEFDVDGKALPRSTTPIWLPADDEAKAYLDYIAGCIAWSAAVIEAEAKAAAEAAAERAANHRAEVAVAGFAAAAFSTDPPAAATAEPAPVAPEPVAPEAPPAD